MECGPEAVDLSGPCGESLHPVGDRPVVLTTRAARRPGELDGEACRLVRRGGGAGDASRQAAAVSRAGVAERVIRAPTPGRHPNFPGEVSLANVTSSQLVMVAASG